MIVIKLRIHLFERINKKKKIKIIIIIIIVYLAQATNKKAPLSGSQIHKVMEEEEYKGTIFYDFFFILLKQF